jgi:hypothetical protein
VPATFAHPAAAAPFTRIGCVFSALMVGSMVPDTWHMLPDIIHRSDTHSLVGQFTYTMPVGLVILALFHHFLEMPLFTLFPQSMQEQLYSVTQHRFRWWPLPRFALIAFSVWVGGITHIVWDSFTHSNGWAVRSWAPLRAVVFVSNNSIMGRDPITVSYILQHICTVFGVLVLLLLYQRWKKNVEPVTVPEMYRLASTLKLLFWVFAVSIMAVSAVYYGDWYSEQWHMRYIAVPKVPKLILMGRQIMAAVDSFTIYMFCFCAILQLRWKIAPKQH